MAARGGTETIGQDCLYWPTSLAERRTVFDNSRKRPPLYQINVHSAPLVGARADRIIRERLLA